MLNYGPMNKFNTEMFFEVLLYELTKVYKNMQIAHNLTVWYVKPYLSAHHETYVCQHLFSVYFK